MSSTYLPSPYVINLVIALAVLAAIGWFVNARLALDQHIRAIVNLALGLVVVGICLWLVNTFIPMAATIKAILNIVVVVAVCVRVLQIFGMWGAVVGLWNSLTRSLHPGAGA
ncbi:MAG TPA: Thivi_2564 family membrane protein [Bryobacteraceae bacterium]|nr:Thivi_2564 family membrane protein [Bryobacteraceae bacterium]